MNKSELKSNIEKLLKQLETEEGNVLAYFLEKYGTSDNWTNKQDEEYEKTQKHLWDAGESLASAITSFGE